MTETDQTADTRPHPEEDLDDRDRRAYEATVRYAARTALSERRWTTNSRARSRAADVLSSASLLAYTLGHYDLSEAYLSRWSWLARDLLISHLRGS